MNICLHAGDFWTFVRMKVLPVIHLLAALMEELSKGAQVLIKIYNRLLDAQNDKDLAK